MCGVVEEGCVVPDHGGRAPHDGDVSYPCWVVRDVAVGWCSDWVGVGCWVGSGDIGAVVGTGGGSCVGCWVGSPVGLCGGSAVGVVGGRVGF